MKRWNSKRIAFIAILIATSIAFVVIGAQAAAISSLPNLKLSLAGLPVKITGYLFGPIVGFVIGFITDILTFLFVPVFYNPLYSCALAISGLVPGIFAWLYFKKFNDKFSKREKIKKLNIKKIQLNHKLVFYQHDSKNEKKDKSSLLINKIKKLNFRIEHLRSDKIAEINLLNFNLFSSVFMVFLCLSVFTLLLSNSHISENLKLAFENISFLQNPRTFIIFIWIGLLIIILFLVITRFAMNPDSYIKMVPIMMFIIFTEFINLPLIAYADQMSIGIEFWVSFLASLLLAPVKVWFNLLIILFATKIVTPLIYRKQANVYN